MCWPQPGTSTAGALGSPLNCTPCQTPPQCFFVDSRLGRGGEGHKGRKGRGGEGRNIRGGGCGTDGTHTSLPLPSLLLAELGCSVVVPLEVGHEQRGEGGVQGAGPSQRIHCLRVEDDSITKATLGEQDKQSNIKPYQPHPLALPAPPPLLACPTPDPTSPVPDPTSPAHWPSLPHLRIEHISLNSRSPLTRARVDTEYTSTRVLRSRAPMITDSGGTHTERETQTHTQTHARAHTRTHTHTYTLAHPHILTSVSLEMAWRANWRPSC